MVLDHVNELSNPNCHHSPFLTNSQALFLLTERYCLFLTIFSIRLLPSENYNHAISFDLLNTPPQILVLLFSVQFSSHKWLQFHQCHTALLPDIAHVLGKLRVGSPPLVAASSMKTAHWAYLYHQYDINQPQNVRASLGSYLQLPGPADI